MEILGSRRQVVRTPEDLAALTTARAVSMVVLGAASLALGLLPLGLVRWLKIDLRALNSGTPRLLVTTLLCFGAGVLLTTSLLHMLPELRHTVADLQESGGLPETAHSVPLAEIFLLCGMFAVYLVEEVVSFLTSKPGPREDLCHGEHQQDAGVEAKGGHEELQVKEGHEESQAKECPLPRRKKTIRESFLDSMSGLLFVIALSFHAIFEGFAVGLEHDASQVWLLLGAVAAHKLVIAFCLGAELLQAGLRRALLFLYIAIFALVTPFGIALGILLTARDDSVQTDTASTAVLEGMACGTLLYVVFCEVLHREREQHQHTADEAPHREARSATGLCQLLALFLGAAAMFGIMNIGSHVHDEDHESTPEDVERAESLVRAVRHVVRYAPWN